MKIERIASNKLKVILSPEDLDIHGLSFESFAADSPVMQDFFWRILREAAFETDFILEEGRVIIEAMPFKNDSVLIFITKPASGTEKPRKVRYRVRQNAVHTRETVQIYAFDSFDDVCAFAKEWRYMGERSSLYSLHAQYYLLLSFEPDTFDKAYVEAQILEFARPCKELSEAYLREHAKQICNGDAIASITRYF